MSKPVVAIVGRQNVGKSTLLNRVVGKPLAIVEDLPGTTRDRIFADVSWQGVEFTIVDTGGLELRPETAVAQGVKEQAEAAEEVQGKRSFRSVSHTQPTASAMHGRFPLLSRQSSFCEHTHRPFFCCF